MKMIDFTEHLLNIHMYMTLNGFKVCYATHIDENSAYSLNETLVLLNNYMGLYPSVSISFVDVKHYGYECSVFIYNKDYDLEYGIQDLIAMNYERFDNMKELYHGVMSWIENKKA